jgi:hypothetical protein
MLPGSGQKVCCGGGGCMCKPISSGFVQDEYNYSFFMFVYLYVCLDFENSRPKILVKQICKDV